MKYEHRNDIYERAVKYFKDKSGCNSLNFFERIYFKIYYHFWWLLNRKRISKNINDSITKSIANGSVSKVGFGKPFKLGDIETAKSVVNLYVIDRNDKE
jgi:hypothetical protein